MDKISNILCGKDLTEDAAAAIKDCKFVVTDSNLAALYPDLTRGAFVIPAGENSKRQSVLFKILSAMQKKRLKRSDKVCSVGGGVVSDITGFAAAVYMRGVNWINIPTSLLAMVDAGIGGKTAINFNGVKNLVGAFHLPERIVISAEFLKTLPEREWLDGAGELIKTCLLTEDAYNALKEKIGGLTAKDIDEVYPLVSLCVNIKNTVVKSDPTEKGLRKILNVGHTVGHALESIEKYALSHGEYVLKGMMTELAMCKDLVDERFYGEVIPLLLSFTSPPTADPKSVCIKSLSDKKNDADTISVMVPTSAGKVTEVKMRQDDYTERYAAAIKELAL
ncbi:MAG: 3-dehydroquinate synthase [Clostridiales bacterium]|nr:3-dehydroquinate synthase [Clostridiales bacterium]